MDALQLEMKKTMLEDLRDALNQVLKNVLPSLNAEAMIITYPEAGVFIKVKGEAPIYPSFVTAKVVVRPTKSHRKHLGLHTLD